MKQPSFTKEQIERFVRNKNVLKFCGKYLAYTPEFKMRAVDEFLNKGMSAKEIFEQAGFDMTAITKFKPRYLISDWLKVFKARGFDGFKRDNRGKGGGRYPKISPPLTDKEKIKKLELEILYLQKENDFLARLRAKRAE